MNRVLVTGANGFIGKALCNSFLRAGKKVHGAVRTTEKFNDLPSGVIPFAVGDLGHLTKWADALLGVNTVIHLASRVHILNDKDKNPLASYRRANVIGTQRLAEQAVKAGVKRFVYVSSVKVHGEGNRRPYRESDAPFYSDPYGQSKWEAENILKKIANETSIEVVVVRPPLVYGPGVKANFFNLLNFINKGIPLPFANIKNHRSMIYIENIVNALMVCSEHADAANQTFLVSDGKDVSTSELLKMLSSAMGKNVPIFAFPLNILKILGVITGNRPIINRLTSSLHVDTTKIQTKLNWNPPFTMETGIDQTVKWFMACR